MAIELPYNIKVEDVEDIEVKDIKVDSSTATFTFSYILINNHASKKEMPAKTCEHFWKPDYSDLNGPTICKHCGIEL